ncbi:MAG: hypothetical protein HY867_09320 [Chloroflexi bacterium]|nr:hypothetical protein [Chloroflexota bacterium]
MNPFQKFVSNHLVFLLTLGVTLALTGCNSQRGTLDDATLEANALAEAINHGLVGDPLATKSVRMSFDEWAKFSGDDAGETPDLPIFVFVIRGEVVWKGPSGKAWWGGEAERFDNITVVLNAETGKSIYVGSLRAGVPLPVEIP